MFFPTEAEAFVWHGMDDLVIANKAYMGTSLVKSTVYCCDREMASGVDDKFRLFAPLNLGCGSVINSIPFRVNKQPPKKPTGSLVMTCERREGLFKNENKRNRRSD